MTDRRSLLKMLPFAGIALPAAKLLGEDHVAESVEIKAIPQEKCRPLIVLRMKTPAYDEAVVRLREQLRAGLDRCGFSDIPAIVLPAYVEMGVFCFPEGADPCSESEHLNSASSAASP